MATYFDGQDLTDDALLTLDTLRLCTVGTTIARDIPKTLNLKDSDHFDYYTKNLRITYPGSSPSTTTMIPNVVIHYDTFDQFGKTGVYVGVPQTLVDAIRTKLNSIGNRPIFEDVALASDEKYWWTRSGFLPAEAGKEYIFIVDEEDGEIVEDAYPGFPELFAQIKSSVVCNITCAVKMTAKIHVDKKGATSETDEWRMGLNITRINVIDIIDIVKPRNAITSSSIAGKKDKVRGKLADRLRQIKLANGQ